MDRMAKSKVAETKLINDIANVIKGAKKEETIMCNVDIEDCLVKGKTAMFATNHNIDEGVLRVLELIKKEAEDKGVNFIMNLNSVAQLHNDLKNMFSSEEEQKKLTRLFELNKNHEIKRIGQFKLDDANQNALTMDSFSVNGNYIKTDKDYKDKIIQYGRLQKHKVNELYLEDFRKETKNTKKVYVLHFDNEVSYFEDNIYKDKTYQFLPVPIKANCKNVQKTAGASLSTDVLTGLKKILNECNKEQTVNTEARKRRHGIIRLKQEQERLKKQRLKEEQEELLLLKQEQERLKKQRLKEEQEELLLIKKQISGMIIKCKLDSNYQTDYEFAKELLINERKETIEMCQKVIYLNKKRLNDRNNPSLKIKERKYTNKELNDKNKVLQEKGLQYIEKNKENLEEQIKNNERYIEEKNKEIKQIEGIESTDKIKGASDQYLKEAIFYLYRHINKNQYEATYRLDEYDVPINVNQNYYKDLMINKLDTNTIKNILLKLELCQKNQYVINDFIVKRIIYDLRQIEIDNAKGRY